MNGVKLLVSQLDNVEPKMLRTMVDDLKNQLGSAIIVLATAADGKVSLIAGVTKDLTDRVKAGELIGSVAQQVGGKGGGRPDMAQAGKRRRRLACGIRQRRSLGGFETVNINK
ncbi:hypothetical protein GGER_08750 [Serratia rubidaea]